MNMKRHGIWMGALPIAALCLVACEREGPMERAGKQADKAVDKAGEQIERAGQEIQKNANPPPAPPTNP